MSNETHKCPHCNKDLQIPLLQFPVEGVKCPNCWRHIKLVTSTQITTK